MIIIIIVLNLLLYYIMGSSSTERCSCSRNDNNQMVCGSGCVNSGESCKSVLDCKSPKLKKAKSLSLPKRKKPNVILKKKAVSLKKIKMPKKPLKTKKVNVVMKGKEPLKGGKTKKARFNYNKMTNIVSRKKAKEIGAVHGIPSISEKDAKGNVLSVTWNNIEGHHSVTVYNDIYRKWHPYPAEVYVVTRRLIKVPDHLMGPLKYASETINIEQLRADKEENFRYGKTGKKAHSLVSGSCASISISAITLKFVEDMCKKYKKDVPNPYKLFKEFRDTYDARVANYIHGKGMKPRIPWYPNILEKDQEKKVVIEEK